MKNKKTIIFDLDGTLYYQLGVQFIMGCRMLLYYFFHFWKLKELKIIIEYRKKRENASKYVVKKQYATLAEKYNISELEIEKLIKKWMIDKPLKVLKFFKDKKLGTIIEELKSKGIQIIIYSDYPTKEKLEALKIQYDKSYDSNNPNILTLKPNPKGLQYIIKSNQLEGDEILLIGDRDSKDGECARSCKVDYIILPKYFRNKTYILIKQMIGVK